MKNAGICFIFCISVSLTRQGQILQVNSMAGKANVFSGISNLLRNGSQTFFANSNTAQERLRNKFLQESTDTETRKDSLKRFWILAMQPDGRSLYPPRTEREALPVAEVLTAGWPDFILLQFVERFRYALEARLWRRRRNALMEDSKTEKRESLSKL